MNLQCFPEAHTNIDPKSTHPLPRRLKRRMWKRSGLSWGFQSSASCRESWFRHWVSSRRSSRPPFVHQCRQCSPGIPDRCG